MIWLTWRQFRTQAAVIAALLAAFAVVLLVTGPHLTSLSRENAFAACHSDCAGAASHFLDSLGANGFYHQVYLFGAVLLILLPVLIGLFWGAPLIARELESGTFRLAWNQTVTRERWLAVKLGLVGLTSMALAGLLSLVLGWWASPIDRAATIGSADGIATRFFPALFGARGVVPIGYAAFAFVLGVLIGLLVHRTVPAMAVTLAVVAAVLIAMPVWIRPHLISPVRVTTPLTATAIHGLDVNRAGQLVDVEAAAPGLPGAWVYSDRVTSASGSTVLGQDPPACQQKDRRPCVEAIARKHLKQVVTYQPASRYWDFQWLELSIFLAAAILLAWACFWLIRRRLS